MRHDGRRGHFALVGVCVLLLAGPVLFAQDSAGGETATAAEEARTERITVEFKETSLREVLDWISKRVGKPITLDAGIEDKVTVHFQDVHYLDAVEEAADRVRCVMRRDGEAIVVSKPPRVTMEFKRAELVEVIHLLAEKAGANIVIDPGVKGEVTMRFSDVPCMRALNAVVKTSGYMLVEEDDGRILRVMDPSKFQAKMEPRVFAFKYIKPDEYYEATIHKRHSGTTPLPLVPFKGFTLLDTLRFMLTRSPNAPWGTKPTTLGRLDYVKDQNCIIAVDTKAVLDQMESIIRQLDIEPDPFLIDVTTVATSNEDLIRMCATWSTHKDGGITIGGVSDLGGDELGKALGKYPFVVGSAPIGASSSATGAASLSGYDMTAALRLFCHDVETRFHMRPNVAVRFDKGSRISVETDDEGIYFGEEPPYAGSATKCFPPGALGTVSPPIQDSSPTPGVLRITMGRHWGQKPRVGADLTIIPHHVDGTNKNILTVIPPDGGLMGDPPQVPGFEKFEPASGATCAVGSGVSRTTRVTHYLVDSGQTLVLAWPHPDAARQRLPKLPFVSETSVLGRVFGRLAEKASKTRVFLFVTPHIYRDPSSPR